MQARILSKSPIHGRIIENHLRRVGVETSREDGLGEFDNELGESELIFCDWNHLDLRGPERLEKVAALLERYSYRFFLVGSPETEGEMQQAVGSHTSQMIFSNEGTDRFRNLINRTRRILFSKMLIDVRVINAFLDATISTLESLCGKPLERRTLTLVDHPCCAHEVTGFIGFTGCYQGTCLVSLPRLLAIELASALSGESQDNLVDGMVTDWVGELMSTISAEACSQLADSQVRFEPSLPTVIVGQRKDLHTGEDAPTFQVTLETEGTQFDLMVKLRPTESLTQKPTHRVLVVEDDPVMRRLVESAASSLGAEVKTARNGFIAGALLESFQPDLMTLDLELPGVKGIEVLRYAKSEERLSGIAVLVISGGSDEEIEGAMKLGADARLAKPVTQPQVMAALRDLLGLDDDVDADSAPAEARAEAPEPEALESDGEPEVGGTPAAESAEEADLSGAGAEPQEALQD